MIKNKDGVRNSHTAHAEVMFSLDGQPRENSGRVIGAALCYGGNYKLGIGYLAQEASVFRKMSVEDNIASVLELTNTTPEYQKDKLESLIAEFRLQKVRKNLGDQLSGGERRRTEIARCLAIDPKFIMLDEPFAGVDPIAVEDIQHIVWKLKDKNIGILITDHNALRITLSDRESVAVVCPKASCRLSTNKAISNIMIIRISIMNNKDLYINKTDSIIC